MWHHSEYPTIDLTFGAGAHVVNFFIDFEKQWPWKDALEYESSVGKITDRMVEKALLSVGMNYIANMYNSRELRLKALDLQAYALKGMQKWMKMASQPRLAPLVACANSCLLGNEISESYRANDGCTTVLIQIEGGLEILRSAGPRCFLSPFGIAVFRAIQLRIVLMGIRKRMPMIDEHQWYSVLFKNNIMVREDKLFNLITRIPRIMQYTDTVKAQMSLTEDVAEAERHMSELLAESYFIQRSMLNFLSTEGPAGYRNGGVVTEASTNILGLSPDTADLMPLSYKFESADDIFIMATYWQYFIHLLILIHEQQETIWRCQNSMSNTTDTISMSSDVANQLHTYITHVCRTIEPVLDDGLAVAWEKVMCNSCAPLRLVIRVLGQHLELARRLEREHTWCIAMAHAQMQLEEIQYILREFVADGLFGTYDLPNVISAPRARPAPLLLDDT